MIVPQNAGGEMRLGAVIPAHDEESTVAAVVSGLAALKRRDDRAFFDTIVVCDNGSRDRTAEVARDAGALVVREPRRGYGYACRRGVDAIIDEVDVLVFVDADGACDPQDCLALISPFQTRTDLVIGARITEEEPGALFWHQKYGNRLMCRLVSLLWGTPVSDLGPLRAITVEAYRALHLSELTYGWTIEMQIRAIQAGFVTQEIPVRARRRRGGVSKVSGNYFTSMRVGVRMLHTIARLKLFPLSKRGVE